MPTTCSLDVAPLVLGQPGKRPPVDWRSGTHSVTPCGPSLCLLVIHQIAHRTIQSHLLKPGDLLRGSTEPGPHQEVAGLLVGEFLACQLLGRGRHHRRLGPVAGTGDQEKRRYRNYGYYIHDTGFGGIVERSIIRPETRTRAPNPGLLLVKALRCPSLVTERCRRCHGKVNRSSAFCRKHHSKGLKEALAPHNG